MKEDFDFLIPKKEDISFSKLKILLPYFKIHLGNFIIASIFLIISSFITIPVPYLTKIVIDKVLLGSKNAKLLVNLVIIMAILHIARSVFSGITQYLFTKLNQEIIATLKSELFKKILKLPFSFYDQAQTGYLLSRIGEIEGLGFFFSSTLVSQLIRLGEFIFALFMLFYLNWKLTLIALSILPFYYLGLKPLSQRITYITKDLLESSAKLMGKVEERISGAEVIKLFATEEREAMEIEKGFKEISRKNILQSIIFTLFSEFNITLIALGGLLILWRGGLDIINGSFTLGSYIAFTSYVQRLYGPIQSLATFNFTIYPALVSLKRVTEIMEMAKEEEGEITINKLREGISFVNVSFSYDGKNKVLENINLDIKVGEKVAIVGPNGSGKTTLIRLLLRMYKPLEGKIFIDGIDLDKIKLSSLREKIGIVSQNIFLFNDTVRNNISYANPNISDNEINNLLKEIDLYHFFMEGFPNGLDTIIGERGVRISGGQKKVIAFLRAILKNPEILILDEATSEIDTRVEEKIFKFIKEKMKDTTCVIITPKDLPKETFINKIVYLENGKIVNIVTMI
ncbi:ABC transporter ATP-binding protein [Dictyoglomus thermophilum]|uniref:ABC-type transport system,membrane ATPase component, putative n=1 Tax=Dictyoglomus thermophilum (strain ATCC 35947 / DSM 3960 / H-6-12) TaxID=309799 RepID=B5YBY8_DICT6|nr:ABC transporter ATP-binding protein [Dictyoglomus thermophilum]ACI19979.1 ABC-type transport system,membrane ATPase component, putative [Dictyoglomus thermophilum H-6-12]